LLHALVRAAGRVKTRDELMAEIREREYEVFDRSMDVHVAALRKKLGDTAQSPRYIQTVRAAGYMFVKASEPSN
jgi:DNA-binding response OmpR family regulator